MASGSPTLNKIERAHQLYREGKYTEALGYYTDALSMAKAKPQKIALHSNRAACHLKLQDFKKAAEECTSVLELDQNHTGALMLRAQTLVTLKEYHSALFDVNRLIELNPSSEMYRNLQARLKTQLESHLLLYRKMRPRLKKMIILMKQNWRKRTTNEKVLTRWKNVKTKKKIWLTQLQETRKVMKSITPFPPLNLKPPEITIFKKDPTNNLDGRLSQNQKDTLILTTPDGTVLKMTLLKKKKTKMRMKILSLSIDFVLKLWALRQSNKFLMTHRLKLNSPRLNFKSKPNLG